jgi:hypothetical protein
MENLSDNRSWIRNSRRFVATNNKGWEFRILNPSDCSSYAMSGLNLEKSPNW